MLELPFVYQTLGSSHGFALGRFHVSLIKLDTFGPNVSKWEEPLDVKNTPNKKNIPKLGFGKRTKSVFKTGQNRTNLIELNLH